MDVKVRDKKVGSDILVNEGDLQIRLKVQGTVLPNNLARVSDLDFGYFVVVRI